MISLLDDYAIFLEAETSLVRGETLFVGRFPTGEGERSGVWLESMPGAPQEKYFDHRTAIIMATSVHESDTELAYQQIMEVFNSMQHNQNLTLSEFHVYYVDGTSVADIEPDIEGRPRFQFSATITYRSISGVIS